MTETHESGRRGMSASYWVVDELAKGLNVPDTETDPHMFMTTERIERADLSAALREYRAMDTWDSSPWEKDEVGVLSTDFINWYRWERL